MIEPTNEAWQPLLEKKLPVLLHLLAWGIYATVVFYGNYARTSPNVFFTHYGLALATHAGSFYLNYTYLIPRILPRRSLLRFLAENILAMVLIATIAIAFEDALLHPGYFSGRIFSGDFSPLLIRISNYMVFALFALVVRLSVDWYRKLRKDREKENEYLKSELAVLKAQINPHFLFNSLNNLYALSLRQAPETPAAILRISEMMRYLLYETNTQLVPLEKEINMIQTYVAMYEMRSKSGDGTRFETSGELHDVMVPPLLLLPLIENVFKHGSSPIAVSVRLMDNVLRVHTSNKMRAAGPEVSGGLGIANLRRRLALLYPAAHELSLQQEQDSFDADLTIQLDKPA
ncbi:sensor histidine kinase [Dyadobacter pollutisoli]|uniref:Sensor histidine kinase n=1 Tax=Dyadobacter pollutisoli TaxID=2910158 RepID=A0A9E8NIY9_9BACT|nr:sensor histidine kinase [Dyadobacter pollutisoli]WAC14874.1 sensor histidine kinase [Dyadobacter pollutisoli]